MHYTKLSGYLFSKEMRMLPALSSISLALGFLFCVLLWYLFLFKTAFAKPLLGLALVWSLLWIVLLLSAIRSNLFIRMQYVCDGLEVSLINGKEQHSYNLENPFFLSAIPFRLYYGKGYSECVYFVISPKRAEQLTDTFVGSVSFTKILQNGGVILPEEAQSWLIEITKLEAISAYPKSLYCSGLTRRIE